MRTRYLFIIIVLLHCFFSEANAQIQEKSLRIALNEKKNTDKRLEAVRKISATKYLKEIVLKAKDQKVREEAYSKIKGRGNDDFYRQLALNDINDDIRYWSALKVNDNELNLKLLKDKEPHIRALGASRISDAEILRKLLKTDTSAKVLISAVRNLPYSDQDIYVDLSKNAKNKTLKIIAIGRLNTSQQKTLREIVQDDSYNLARMEAVKKITDQDFLKDVIFKDLDFLVQLEALQKVRIQGNQSFFKEVMDNSSVNQLKNVAKRMYKISLRVEEVNSISNQQELIKIALDKKNHYLVRMEAIKKIDNVEVLKSIVAKPIHGWDYEEAYKRLQELGVLK